VRDNRKPSAAERARECGNRKVITESEIFDHLLDVHPSFEHAGVNKVVHTMAKRYRGIRKVEVEPWKDKNRKREGDGCVRCSPATDRWVINSVQLIVSDNAVLSSDWGLITGVARGGSDRLRAGHRGVKPPAPPTAVLQPPAQKSSPLPSCGLAPRICHLTSPLPDISLLASRVTQKILRTIRPVRRSSPFIHGPASL
jgi:hypothetical protein